MANESLSFSDFPDDIQLCIVSFLSPPDIASFACTCRRAVSLCRSDSQLWYTLCDRRWGSKTQIKRWGGGNITYKLLYRTLNEWENLIGFWRRCGQSNVAVSSPLLVLFEWGPSFLACSRVSPSQNGSYQVKKMPFLWMGISPDGQIANFLDREGHSEILSGDFECWLEFVCLDQNLVPVNVNFMGSGHVLVEENVSFSYENIEERKGRNGFRRSSSSENLQGEDSEEVNVGTESGYPGSLPDRFLSEMYAHFANRTSPSSDKSWRKQKRKEKERQSRRKWEPEHFLKIVDCTPTPERPLQGLWKGICSDMNLDFYIVRYDEIGGIICRKVGDLSSSYSAPVFWTSRPIFMESPFSAAEERIYDDRIHLEPLAAEDHNQHQHSLTDIEAVTRILCINSSYDIAIPGLAGREADCQHGEGRIWQYKNGTFGFGFLRDQFIIDLKHIIQGGSLLDTEYS
ncbi:hypothetical protein SLEP1_g30232 [Rubroshorea leprosula]|uniref:F-box protein n=1 Tax=Rubroshorea leprosula TaxID=152421 RepID=A0AAV5JZF1_9ROSI|nr:hypothetical protein SLEP1_g30232 [Rubroshorea leprosula]